VARQVNEEEGTGVGKGKSILRAEGRAVASIARKIIGEQETRKIGKRGGGSMSFGADQKSWGGEQRIFSQRGPESSRSERGASPRARMPHYNQNKVVGKH